jgi:hypothetical protein
MWLSELGFAGPGRDPQTGGISSRGDAGAGSTGRGARSKPFGAGPGIMLTEEEPDALHVGLFWFPSVGSAGVGIPAWHREPIERAPVWESIHLASWPANRLARPGWRRLLPELAAGSGGSVHENGCGAGHVVPHGGGGLRDVAGFDGVDDVRMPFDIHVFQRAIHPGEHD